MVAALNWATSNGKNCTDCRHSFIDPLFTVVKVLSCRSPKVIASNSGIPRACSVARAPIGKSSCGVKAAFFEKK